MLSSGHRGFGAVEEPFSSEASLSPRSTLSAASFSLFALARAFFTDRAALEVQGAELEVLFFLE
jgi:hypothetical protein